jgi:RimJ/RimL family protein N-acetyltransferase
MIEIKENNTYLELELFNDGEKIGEAEINTTESMLSRIFIYEHFQDKGYGTEIIKQLTEKYNLNNLWVKVDNEKAIHVYEKCGYEIKEAPMHVMRRIEYE